MTDARSRFVEAMKAIDRALNRGKMAQAVIASAVHAFAEMAFYGNPGTCTPAELVNGFDFYLAALEREVFSDGE